MALDFAHRHAAGIQAQDIVVEAIEPRLSLGDELRLKTAGAVSGDGNLDRAFLGQDPVAASTVAGPATCRIALLVAEVLAQFGAERSLNALLSCLNSPLSPVRSFGFSWLARS